MNDSKTKENKEPMDESNVDWSDFGDVWWKKYQTGLEKVFHLKSKVTRRQMNLWTTCLGE